MADEAPKSLQIPAGLIVVTTYGSVQAETVQSLMDTRSFCERSGLQNAQWRLIGGALVDKARNDAVSLALSNPQCQYLVFLDADMAWKSDFLAQLLETAYGAIPLADIVGGWCPLRGEPYLPTIDTGTGTWEVTLPGQGPVEVMRTGGACLLIKRHVFEKMEAPWFGVRPVPRGLDLMQAFDNYSRIKFDGRNPFRVHKEWDQLLKCASDEAVAYRQQHPTDLHGSQYTTLGEDSGFCDRAKGLGFRIFVQTNAVCNHVDRRVIGPDDHVKAVRKLERDQNLACGVLE